MYLCGECGIILNRSENPPAVQWCFNCGAVNAVHAVEAVPAFGFNRTQGQVVVIDDEPELLNMVHEILCMEGFSVLCLANAAAARTLTAVRPAMFLVDMMLPNTTGIELARELKATRYAQTPMVAMSASNRVLQDAADSHFFEGTLPKPFDLSDLLAVVGQYATIGATA